jgi:hypothetical protein
MDPTQSSDHDLPVRIEWLRLSAAVSPQHIVRAGSQLLHPPDFRAARGVTGERATTLPAKRPDD